ncbi:probable cyclic nucleotide-gated ion channel 5 [Tanacetum coccineum]
MGFFKLRTVILKENKDKKDAKFNERFKHRPPKALDEDETEFLDTLELVIILSGSLMLVMDLQSLTIRLEEMRIKRRDSEQWMHHMLLPHDLRQHVRRYDQYKRLETREVDESNCPTI